MAGTSWPTLTPGNRAKASEVENKFDWLEGDIVPMLGGAKADAAYDLGQSSFRWRDIHSSRQFLGGAGSVTEPTYSYLGSADSGLYFSGTSPRMAANGVFAGEWKESGGITQYLIPNGSSTNPPLAFSSDNSLGLYSPTTSTIAIKGNNLSPSNPCFVVALSTTVSNVTGDGTNYTIVFDTEIIDQSNSYTMTGNYFVTPIAGNYIFNFKCQFTQATSGSVVNININSGSIGLKDFASSYSNGTYDKSLTHQIYLNAGVTVSASIFGAAINKVISINGKSTDFYQTVFSGYLLG